MSLDQYSRYRQPHASVSLARLRASAFTLRGAPSQTRRASGCAQWLGIREETFYDPMKVAIVSMGFCFPGLDAKGGDLPPRRECAETWRERLFHRLPNLELILLVGLHAQSWHLGARAVAVGLTETVTKWRDVYRCGDRPRLMPIPHPSWRNNAWLKRNPWFELDLLPALRADVAQIVAPSQAG